MNKMTATTEAQKTIRGDGISAIVETELQRQQSPHHDLKAQLINTYESRKGFFSQVEREDGKIGRASCRERV